MDFRFCVFAPVAGSETAVVFKCSCLESIVNFVPPFLLTSPHSNTRGDLHKRTDPQLFFLPVPPLTNASHAPSSPFQVAELPIPLSLWLCGRISLLFLNPGGVHESCSCIFLSPPCPSPVFHFISHDQNDLQFMFPLVFLFFFSLPSCHHTRCTNE